MSILTPLLDEVALFCEHFVAPTSSAGCGAWMFFSMKWPGIENCRYTRNTKRVYKQCSEITLTLFGRPPRDTDKTTLQQPQRVGALP